MSVVMPSLIFVVVHSCSIGCYFIMSFLMWLIVFGHSSSESDFVSELLRIHRSGMYLSSSSSSSRI